MRNTLLALALGLSAMASALPAMAQATDTLNALIAKGAVMRANGYTILMQYNEDGTYMGRVGEIAFIGEWRVEGMQLCTASRMSPAESCTEYPAGKRAGEEFDVQSPTLGEVSVRINE